MSYGKETENYFAAEVARLVPELRIDSTLSLGDINRKFFDALQELAPFGTEHQAPVFVSTGVAPQNLRMIGKEKNHAKFRAVQDGQAIEAIGFNLASAFRTIERDDLIDIVYEISLNEWNGKETLQLKLLDMRQHVPSADP